MEQDRPTMPAAYGITPGSAGQLPWAWADSQLAQARNYWLCTTRRDGRPHAMPVWGLWLDSRIVFSTDPASMKGRNIAARPEVVIHLESGDDVVVVEGMTTAFDHDVQNFLDAYDVKYGYRPEPGPTQGVYAVRPTVVLGWREADFPATATRWTLQPPATASSLAKPPLADRASDGSPAGDAQ